MKKTIIALLTIFQLTHVQADVPVSDPIVSLSDFKQVQCLADNVYHEAKGEPDEGKLAIALVTMNRVATPGFPATVCGVVYEKTRGLCQFSWACRKWFINRESESYKQIHALALDAYLNYSSMVDITKRSLFFHADSVNPGWNLYRTTKLGRHIFYKHRGNDVQERGENAGRRTRRE